MKRPELYECAYAHDRRKHRHRCWVCARIITEGELVIMQPIAKGSRAMHKACGDKRLPEGHTYRDLAQMHLDEHAKRLGFK